MLHWAAILLLILLQLLLILKRLQRLQEVYNFRREEIVNHLIQGFEMALHGGPLCEEPVMGVCYIVESIRFKEDG
jgi:translation elongation factor EF-G